MGRFPALFEPAGIGSLRLKNRLIMAAMGNSLAAGDGCVTPAMLDYYRARAAGGVGMVVTQLASINAEDMMPYSLGIYDDRFLPGVRQLVDTIHEGGARECIQLMHPGMLLLLLRSIPADMTIKVPSITGRMEKGKPYEPVTEADIGGYVSHFVEAACRVKEAGADAVELHACHGCLVSTFLSPATNHRTDSYGGSVANRARFAREITEGMRRALGAEFPIVVRMNGNDDVQGGVTIAEATEQTSILETAGADAISVSSGLEYWSCLMAPSFAAPEGVNLAVASEVKQAVRIPVITAGKITPELAEKAVSDKRVDFIALGRPLLADPELPRKLSEDRPEDIWRCLYCNNCLRTTWRSCTVNPFLYRESMLPLKTTEAPRKMMVVGGGPAGMQAARLLAERGHQVSLYEKGNRLGGQWNTAGKLPGKQDFDSLTEHLERSLEMHGVRVVMNAEITREQVLKAGADAVVVATGAVPVGLDIPGADRASVVQANDVLEGAAEPGERVVVIGGRSLGMETAVLLAEQGKRVTLVCRSGLGGKRGPDEKIAHRALLRRMIELGIPTHTNTPVLEIAEDSVVVRTSDEVVALPADTVVLAVGVKPVDGLARELEGTVAEIHMIGDCLQPGNAAQATYSAARLALEL